MCICTYVCVSVRMYVYADTLLWAYSIGAIILVFKIRDLGSIPSGPA